MSSTSKSVALTILLPENLHYASQLMPQNKSMINAILGMIESCTKNISQDRKWYGIHSEYIDSQ